MVYVIRLNRRLIAMKEQVEDCLILSEKWLTNQFFYIQTNYIQNWLNKWLIQNAYVLLKK